MTRRTQTQVPTLDFERKYWDEGAELVAGVDEAGRGPLAGPVVAAAVVFPPNVYIDGVNDSKRLSEKRREVLFHQIYEQAVSVGVGVVSHEVIDQINIFQASILAMRKAVDRLSVIPQVILADGISFTHDSLRYQNIVHGDSQSFAIAAASIVAKVTRDHLMREFHEVFPAYGFDRHKGYGTARHFDAIRQFGLCAIHRRSFHMPTNEHGHRVEEPWR
jgi:ribonuclease HII